MRRNETGLLVPYRALGLICSPIRPVYVPAISLASKSDGLIACSVGSVLCVYTVNPLRMLFTSAPFDAEISFVEGDQFRFYLAVKNSVYIYNRMRQIERRIIMSNTPSLILSFTDIFVVVDSSSFLYVIDVEGDGLLMQLEAPASVVITTMVHPLTYKNKVLLGTSSGALRLINIRTGKLIHEFASCENFNAAVTVLEQSTAVDVIAIGLANGHLHLKNIRTDELICSFKHECSVTAISFRTDGLESMVSADANGMIAVWDLKERRLVGSYFHAHKGPIVWLHFLLGQSFLLSSGTDNRLMKWILRNEHSLPELHTALEGHEKPVTSLAYCTEHQLVSASQDAHIRRFNTNSVNRVASFGIAREVRRGDLSSDRFMDVILGTVLQIEVSRGREAVWDNMICRHENSPVVSTWSTRLMKRGQNLLCHERFNKNSKFIGASCTVMCLSSCGNFALLGYSSGHFDVFNMQSGLHKFSFAAPSSKTQNRTSEPEEIAHTSSVTGIYLDIVNRNVVSGASDGTVHFWTFNPPQMIARMQLPGAVKKMRSDRINHLLAVALNNGQIGVIDVLCRRLARLFKNAHDENAQITSLEFAYDGRWLVSADNQCFIKIWDLPSGHLIDILRCPSPCVGLAFSENSKYLATCHQNERAVFLWANKELFFPSNAVASTVFDSTRVSDENSCECVLINDQRESEVSLTTFPTMGESLAEQVDTVELVEVGEENEVVTSSQTRVFSIDQDDDDEMESEVIGSAVETDEIQNSQVTDRTAERLDSIEPGLLTLSGLPSSRWAGLPHLDLIRERNKPLLPPQKLRSAPFFLPTLENLEHGLEFELEAVERWREEIRREREEQQALGVSTPALIARRRLDQLNTAWINSLMNSSLPAEFLCAFSKLKDMPLSRIDFQLRCLDSTEALSQFVRMLIAVLETRSDWDLVQSYMAAFINIHYEAIWGVDEELSNKDEEVVDTDESREADVNLLPLEKDKARPQIQIRQQERSVEMESFNKVLERLLTLQKKCVEDIQSIHNECTSLAAYIKSALVY